MRKKVVGIATLVLLTRLVHAEDAKSVLQIHQGHGGRLVDSIFRYRPSFLTWAGLESFLALAGDHSQKLYQNDRL
jgi:hypothetical protein